LPKNTREYRKPDVLSATKIYICGIDGAGKTTIIEGLMAQLSDMGIKTRYRWCRYNHILVKPLLLLLRVTGRTWYETIDGARVGYRDLRNAPHLARAFVFLTYIDTVLAFALRIVLPGMVLPGVIVVDRWVPDIMVDVAVDIGVEDPLGTLWGRLLSRLRTKNSLCFLIMRPTTGVLRDRPVNRLDRRFEERLRLYKALTAVDWIVPVTNAGPPEEAINQVLSSIRTYLAGRT
jgi:hypothetical protein